jgi:hypothetical protein
MLTAHSPKPSRDREIISLYTSTLNLISYLKIAHAPTVLKSVGGLLFYPDLRLLRYASQSSSEAIKLAAVNGLTVSLF